MEYGSELYSKIKINFIQILLRKENFPYDCFCIGVKQKF